VNLTRFRLATRRIFRGYAPRFYPGKLTYFRAAIRPTGIVEDPANGWGGMAAALEVIDVPGGHTSGLKPPLVTGTARAYQAALARDEARRARDDAA